MAISSAASNLTLPYTPPIPKPNSSTTAMFSSSNSTFFTNTLKPLTLVQAHRSSGKSGFSCNCLFGLGVPELVVIAGVATLVFGPKKLPEVGRSIGKTFKSFQQAAKEFETELKKEPDSLQESTTVNEFIEQENEDVKSSKVSL